MLLQIEILILLFLMHLVGDPLLSQHLFWFFGHPEVYILILPGFGVISNVIEEYSGKRLFGRNTMLCNGWYRFFRFYVCWLINVCCRYDVDTRIFFSGNYDIAIPTGIKVFSR